MAVVQISRIQMRRGQKNAGSGLPQLASGEIGWAVDTQELYIGNGSVSEGAPAVGNTKILTEHENIFTFANTYTYKDTDLQTGASATQPIKRTLQSRLDDVVNAKNFGVTAGTNVTVSLQRAVDQLFLNSATKANSASRVTLYLDPGEYTVTGVIHLPPYTSIVGAGSDKTVINASANTCFKTINSLSLPGAPADESTTAPENQSRNIRLEGMTIKQTTANTALELQSTKDSVFRDMKFFGPWSIGDSITAGQCAVDMISLATSVTCENNLFENCKFTKWTYPVRSNDDITNNTWKKCNFHTNLYGVVFGQGTILGAPNQTTGPVRNNIIDCTFDEIARESIWIENGTHNASNQNRFYNVGNVNGTESNAGYPALKYIGKHNISTSDYFKRFELLSYNSSFFTAKKFFPIVMGTCNSFLNTQDELPVVTQDPALRYFKLPGDADVTYEIDYVYDSSAVVAHRSGKLIVTLDKVNNSVVLEDDFHFVGDASNTTNLTFAANFVDEDSDAIKETIEITIKNTTSADVGTFKFNVKQKR